MTISWEASARKQNQHMPKKGDSGHQGETLTEVFTTSTWTNLFLSAASKEYTCWLGPGA